MAGPLSQFSLFDLPASAGEPQEASPAPAQEPTAAAQPDAGQPAPTIPEAGPQPELPSPQTGTIGYFEEDEADVPTLPQPHNMVTEPEPALQSSAIPPEPEMQPEPTTTLPVIKDEPIPADEVVPVVVEIALDEVPELIVGPMTEVAELPEMPVVDPDQPETAPAPVPVAFEEPDMHFAEDSVTTRQDFTDVSDRVVAPAPGVSQQQEAQELTPTPELRPTRSILAFDIEPLGEAAPEDIPREFLSGRPIPGQPKPKSTRGRKSTKATEAGPDKILVPEDEELFKRQYYPISEVATMFGVNISQIRYWENEFPQLKPRKNGKGDRLFRPEDVKTLVLIHDLIRRRKYTLEGAKEFLKVNNGEDVRFPLIQQLQKLKMFLNELKANM